jgi:hypothetical protein
MQPRTALDRFATIATIVHSSVLLEFSSTLYLPPSIWLCEATRIYSTQSSGPRDTTDFLTSC